MTLTNSDLNKIGYLIDTKLEDKLDKEDFETKLTEFKSDLFEKIDPILKEVVTAREERPLIENRLEALENIHKTGSHSLASF